MTRPKKYDTAAERVAAYRERNARIDIVVPKETAETLADIAKVLAMPRSDLVHAMLRFALTNHNWKKSGAVWAVKK